MISIYSYLCRPLQNMVTPYNNIFQSLWLLTSFPDIWRSLERSSVPCSCNINVHSTVLFPVSTGTSWTSDAAGQYADGTEPSTTAQMFTVPNMMREQAPAPTEMSECNKGFSLAQDTCLDYTYNRNKNRDLCKGEVLFLNGITGHTMSGKVYISGMYSLCKVNLNRKT